jgi:hypothetical protein
MKSENWNEPNQRNYTIEELQTCYDTADLVGLFDEALIDGYTALSLGLIIDLIKERAEEV